MKTKVTENEEFLIVSMQGRLSFESNVPLRHDLQSIVDRIQAGTSKRVIFDLEHLDFVGSSGISNFVQALHEINKDQRVVASYCNVKSEFQRVMKAYDAEDTFAFFDDVSSARQGIDN